MIGTVPLAELAAPKPYAFVGGPFGSKLTSADYVAEGIPVIRGSNLTSGRFLNEDNFVFVTEKKLREDLFSNLAHPGDIVFTQRGTLGQVSIIPEKARFDAYVISQSQMKLSVDPFKADTRFIYYWFSSRQAVGKIISQNSSSGVPHINLTVLRNFKVPLPALRVQRRIADFLSAYDDLIDNNRRRLVLLEEAARMLYREWFVHFRFPGHEHVKIIDGLPERWARWTLRQCASFASGGTPSKARANFWSGDIPWISSGELTRMRVGEAEHNVTPEAVKAGSRYAERDTILVVVRGMSLAKDFRMGLVARRVCFNQDLKALVPDRGIEGLYLFHALEHQRERLRQLTGEASHGTKKMETSVLGNVKIVVPILGIRRHFLDVLEPMHAQWDALFQANLKLAQARDLLLPRLMNGQIAV